MKNSNVIKEYVVNIISVKSIMIMMMHILWSISGLYNVEVYCNMIKATTAYKRLNTFHVPFSVFSTKGFRNFYALNSIFIATTQ